MFYCLGAVIFNLGAIAFLINNLGGNGSATRVVTLDEGVGP
jgi:hypothetical protein